MASYSSRGPDVNNELLETADVLKPNVMAPGSSIWAAWSPNSEGDVHIKGMQILLNFGQNSMLKMVDGHCHQKNFAPLLVGTMQFQ